MGFLRIVLIHTAFLAEIGVIDARGNRRSGRDRILNGSWGRHIVLLSMWVRTGQDVFGLLLFLHIEQANAMSFIVLDLVAHEVGGGMFVQIEFDWRYFSLVFFENCFSIEECMVDEVIILVEIRVKLLASFYIPILFLDHSFYALFGVLDLENGLELFGVVASRRVVLEE